MTKEELEKEAKEYLTEHSEYSEVFEETFVAIDTLTAMVEFAEPREKRIEELEKENAQLKDYRLTTLAKQQTKMSKYALNLEHKLGWYDTQLTKAKEIIKELVRVEYADFTNGDYSNELSKVLEQAEQFLNSEGEK